MALYARTLLNRDTPRARSLSLSLISLFTLFSHTLLFLILYYTLLSPTHPFLPDAPTALVSSFSNFPRWRYRPLCFFLDMVKRLNAATSSLRFLSHFLSLLRGLICRNGAICCRNATEEKRNRFSAFASLLSCDWLCAYHVRYWKSMKRHRQANTKSFNDRALFVLLRPWSQKYLANRITNLSLKYFISYDLILSE